LIFSLKEGFPKFYKQKTSLKIRWDLNFTDSDLANAYISGTGQNEKVIFKTKFWVGGKGIPFEFVEDVNGTLTIKVNERTVGSVKPMDGWSKNLLKDIANSILREK